eukprot:CAMPEP_0178511450 /NCGR_PEP_ID=MMETSP0696-20121128/22374_1 /TAXON_ID=265572 /ORGANISM="Extubocellulus spinifer, Strain CCMP396" /LENGTH=61 /DNA_ID=CAMNT_0020141235 /DNA_START=309 /DNA_END=494 /DNA_ORIENTATION=-
MPMLADKLAVRTTLGNGITIATSSTISGPLLDAEKMSELMDLAPTLRVMRPSSVEPSLVSP